MGGTQLDRVSPIIWTSGQVSGWFVVVVGWRPQQDSNLRTRLRRPLLYPLSYGGSRIRRRRRARRAGARLPAPNCPGHGTDLPARPSPSR